MEGSPSSKTLTLKKKTPPSISGIWLGGPRASKGGSLWFSQACGVQCLALQEPKVVALAMVFRKGRRIERKKKMCLREDDEEEESFLNKEGGD